MIIGLSEKYTKMIKEKPQGWEDRLWSCLMHEREHLVDFKRLGVFLVFIGYVFVFFPVGLAYIRARMERRGYIQTLKCWYLLDPDWAMGLTRNSKGQTARQWWINQFTGGNYGYCFPFKKIVGGWYDQELSRLQRAAA